jgi:hypothetical protein
MHRAEKGHSREIIDEYRKKFVETFGKIQRFRGQQKSLVQATTTKLKDQAREHPELEYVVAAYHLAKMDEVIDISPEDFADDVRIYRETLTPIEFTPEVKPTPLPKGRREVVVLRKVGAEPEMPKELKEELTILALLVNSLTSAWSAPINTHKIIVDEKIASTPDEVVQAIIIMNALQPWISVTTELHEKDHFKPDLRWLVSLARYTFEENLRRKGHPLEPRSPSRIFEEVTSRYPISHGDEYQWDILFFELVHPLWSKLFAIAEAEVIKGREELEAERRATPHIQKALKEREAIQSSIDFAQAPLEFRLHHVFKREQELTEKDVALFESLMDRVIRRTLVEKYGVQDIKDQTELLQIATTIIMSLTDRFPELLLPIIEPSERLEFFNDPALFIKSRPEEVETRVTQRIRRGTGMKITPFSVGKAFAKYIKLAVSMQR